MIRKINDTIQHGKTSVEFNTHNLSNSSALNIYHELLGPLVKDPELISILAVNAQKFKHRFFFKTTIYDTAGREIATIKDLGRKTVQEYIQKYSNNAHLQTGRKLGSPDGMKSLELAAELEVGESDVNISSGIHTIGAMVTNITFAKGQTTLQG